jgi:hypothetical protein
MEQNLNKCHSRATEPVPPVREVVGSNPGKTCVRFLVVFLSPSRQTPGQYLKLGHDHFITFNLRKLFYNLTPRSEMLRALFAVVASKPNLIRLD